MSTNEQRIAELERRMQAYVESPGGRRKSTIDKFKVYDDLG